MHKILTTILVFPLICAGDSVAETQAANKRDSDFHPAVTAFFESKDPFIQKTILPNIEANRKSDVVLTIVGAEDKPVAGATISAHLNRHEFLFGHCDLATEKNPKKKELLNELFHFTCPGNATKWRAHEKKPGKHDFSRVDLMLDHCKKHDITFEWHFLSGYHPNWFEDITSVTEKARHQVENSKTVLKRYGDKVRFFQVINEDWRTHVDRAKVYIDQTAWFSELRKEFPDVELGVCDCWSFNLERRLPVVEELKERYPGINFISMHAHNPRQLWASPKEMYDTYDPFLNSGIKIHLTEFGIILGEISGNYRSGEWDEDKLAEYFVQALATSFSHKAVRVFNFWSNYKKFTGNPLFNEQGQPNEKYLAIQSLLHDKLTTKVSGQTNPAGSFAFRGFHGKYDLTITLPSGKKSTIKAVVAGDKSKLKLVLDEKSGSLKVTSLKESVE